MKSRIVSLAIGALIVSCTITKYASAQPSPEQYRDWCQQEEVKLSKELRLPKNFDQSKAGNLRAIVLFHLTNKGQLTNVRPLRKNAADSAVITIPPAKFAQVEKAMMTAVKNSSPTKNVPSSFSKNGEGVSFAYEPNSDKPIRVLLIAE